MKNTLLRVVCVIAGIALINYGMIPIVNSNYNIAIIVLFGVGPISGLGLILAGLMGKSTSKSIK